MARQGTQRNLPDAPSVERKIRTIVDNLIKEGALASEILPPPARQTRQIRVSDPNRLIEIIQGQDEEESMRHGINPATLRSELHRYAELVSEDGREYDTMILMAAAHILRDPSKRTPPPTQFLPNQENVREEDPDDAP